MKIEASTVEEYLVQLSADRRQAIEKLRTILKDNLDPNFKETLSYGMIAYVVPHSLYEKGYHCNPQTPLPFINLASQKNFIALYHMGIYANNALYDWFVEEYPKHCTSKLDMGKSCIRFKKIEQIPYDLIAELAQKITVEDWIQTYEEALLKK